MKQIAHKFEHPLSNNLQSDTVASGVLAAPIRALYESRLKCGPAMEESEHDAWNLKQLELYVEERFLAGKFPLRDYIEKVQRGVAECRVKISRATIKGDRLL